MERLLDHDFQVILDFLLEIYSPAALRKFPDRLIESLHKLIPSDLVTYDEMDPDRRTSTDRGSPADMMRPELRQESWPRVMQEHPPLMYFRRTGDPCACRISDFLSQQKFRCSALYQEFYRKMGIEDVLCKALVS